VTTDQSGGYWPAAGVSLQACAVEDLYLEHTLYFWWHYSDVNVIYIIQM